MGVALGPPRGVTLGPQRGVAWGPQTSVALGPQTGVAWGPQAGTGSVLAHSIWSSSYYRLMKTRLHGSGPHGSGPVEGTDGLKMSRRACCLHTLPDPLHWPGPAPPPRLCLLPEPQPLLCTVFAPQRWAFWS